MRQSKTNIDMKRTGQRLKNCISQNGYSVRDIQEYLGLSCPQPVYRWFKGKMLPSVDNLLKLSELLGVHMESLLIKEQMLELKDISTFKKRMIKYMQLLAA